MSLYIRGQDHRAPPIPTDIYTYAYVTYLTIVLRRVDLASLWNVIITEVSGRSFIE